MKERIPTPLFFCVLILLFLGACRPNATDPLPSVEKPFHQVQFVRYSPDCENDSTSCAVFKVIYPEFDSAETLIRLRINRTILEQIKETISEGQPSNARLLSLERLAAEFFRDYSNYADGTMPWLIECNGKVLYHNERVFSVSIASQRFTGGAHPNEQTSMLNFDVTKGNLLQLDDIIIDMKTFRQLAEREFRQEHGLEEDDSLKKVGFHWENGLESFNNFALTSDGVLLYYNTYEIAAFAQGRTEILLPYTLLDGVIDPAFVAGE